jgi:hypothetical protein
MSFFGKYLNDDFILSIAAGADLDKSKIVNNDEIMTAAIHCCINGPVGVNKETTFPTMGNKKLKIKDLYKENLTNKMWKNFCKEVAIEMKKKVSKDLLEATQCYKQFKNLFPLYDEIN